MTLEQIVRADVRGHYKIGEHHVRDLKDLGRADLLDTYKAQVELAAEDLARRARMHDKVIAAVEDECTRALQQAQKQREANARPYPSTLSRPV